MVTTYYRRLVDRLLDELLEQLPALMVMGPRAAGKTTAIGRRAATIIRLDREAEAAVFAADPDAALRGLEEPVLLDEWQVVPGVLGAVRRAVDADPRSSRFFLTGSARAHAQQQTWAATGRVTRVDLFPMTVREVLGRSGDATFFDRISSGGELQVAADTPDLQGYVELALTSGFPLPALQLSGRAREAWLESYVAELLTHDVEQLEESSTRNRDPERLRRYFEAYALNSSNVTDHTTIYRAADVNKATASAYERLLGDLFVIEELPAWTSNRLKRLVRQPKRYVVDPALIAAALRIDVRGVLQDGDLLGRVLDTFVAAQLRPELALSASRPRLHHLRTREGRHEIDLVAELAGRALVGIEVKATAAPTADDARHLRWLQNEVGDRFLAGVVLHTGARRFQLGQKITAAPISVLWG